MILMDIKVTNATISLNTVRGQGHGIVIPKQVTRLNPDVRKRAIFAKVRKT